MSDLDFGGELRHFRLQTMDPDTTKPLTQQRLGELLGTETGRRSAYTGAAVSDWERGASRIDADERLLLIGLVKILNRYGGIETSGEADRLLEAGNFRALNPKEREKIFPGETDDDDPPAPSRNPSNMESPAGNLNLVLHAEFRSILEEAKKGPPPYWPRAAVFLMGKFTQGLTALRMLRGIIWFWIAYIAYLLIAPSLDRDFQRFDDPLSVMTLYAAGSLVLPAFIGGMTNTKDNPYWIGQKIQNSPVLRLYVHQGAYVGFHVGYFPVLLFTLAQTLLGFETAGWIEASKIVPPLLAGCAGARLVPYNLWLAYNRLSLRDGGVFFIFAVLGPLWALFYLEFYKTLLSPVVSAIIILSALTIAAGIEALKQRKRITGA